MKRLIAYFTLLTWLSLTATFAQPTTTKPSFTDMLTANCTTTHFLIGGANSPGCGPTPTRAGDVAYFNGTVWTTLAGNNSGTNCFAENSSGVPSWATCSGGATIASGTAALGTSAISSGACATVVTVAATNVATTDTISFTPNADITAVTGYAPVTTGGLAVYPYPTANNVNFKVCNPTASSITPGAVTLNWRVTR